MSHKYNLRPFSLKNVRLRARFGCFQYERRPSVADLNMIVNKNDISNLFDLKSCRRNMTVNNMVADRM